ncbi:MAG: hypothetical protein D6757_09940 [Alphaproteobacteria bacterium]|nr:MAG: hypothetical protein D6757_09940 [Alphaproteobacteria bacterium]
MSRSSDASDAVRRIGPLLATAGWIALLAGCTGTGPFNATGPSASGTDEPAPAVAGEAVTSTAPSPAEPAALPPSPRAGRLLEREAGELVSLIGRPDLVRREETVQIFQYRADDGCILELALYEQEGRFLVRYVTARRRDGERVHPDGCLARLLPPERWSALAEPPVAKGVTPTADLSSPEAKAEGAAPPS